MKLMVEYEGSKIQVYKEDQHTKRNKTIIFVDDLDFTLQATLDDEIFLQIWDRGCDECFNFSQKGSLVFLEKLLEYKCFYTYTGEIWNDESLTKFCDEIFIDMEPNIQEIWDLREDMLYWLSYG